MTNYDDWKTTDRDGEDASIRHERLFALMDAKLGEMTREELARALANLTGDDADLRTEITERTADWDSDRLESFLEGL